MSLSWSAACIQYLLFIFNFFLLITGVILFVVGVTIKTCYDDYETFLDEKYLSAPNLLIAVGVIIFIVSFFGCWGAIRQNYCLTLTFSFLLIVIFILELSAGISGYVLKDETTSYLEDKLNATMHRYGGNHSEVTKAWDLIQRGFECCGVNKPSDWVAALHTKGELPISCCNPESGVIGSFNCSVTSPYLYKTGCEVKFGSWVRDHALTIGGLGFGFAFVQLLGIAFSWHLSQHIKRNYYEHV